MKLIFSTYHDQGQKPSGNITFSYIFSSSNIFKFFHCQDKWNPVIMTTLSRQGKLNVELTNTRNKTFNRNLLITVNIKLYFKIT